MQSNHSYLEELPAVPWGTLRQSDARTRRIRPTLSGNAARAICPIVCVSGPAGGNRSDAGHHTPVSGQVLGGGKIGADRRERQREIEFGQIDGNRTRTLGVSTTSVQVIASRSTR